MGAMLFNREGRRVIVDPARFHWYIENHGYRRIPYTLPGKTRDTGRVAVVREIGGLGDVICVQSVVAALQSAGCKVTLYTPQKFWPVCVADALIDTTVAVPLPGPEYTHDQVFNMFCPAGDYEAEIGMRPVEGRIRNFCAAAEVAPQRPPLERVVRDPIVLGNGRPVVGIQPISENPSKDLSPAQTQELCVELERRGARCVVFHDRPFPASLPGADLIIRRPLEEVARRILGLDAMIAVDSGLLHLAAALETPTVGLFGPTNGPITCEFYHAVSVFQAAQPEGGRCFTPCYYAQQPNGYICHKRQGDCMKELDMAEVADEAMRRTASSLPVHRIAQHWWALNLECARRLRRES